MATYSDNPQSDPQFTALDDFQGLLRLGKRLALPVFRRGRLACRGSWSCGCRYAATFLEPSSDRPSLCSRARCLSCAAGCEDRSAVLRKYDAGAHCRRSQMILHERRRLDRHFAVLEQRRKDEIIDFRMWTLLAPFLQIFRKRRMHRHIAVRGRRLGFAVRAFRPSLAYADLLVAPQEVRPAQRDDLRCAERRGGASQDESEMQRVCQLIENGKGLLRRDDDRLVNGLRSHLDMLHGFLSTRSCRMPTL
jgi:hypothetical protein